LLGGLIGLIAAGPLGSATGSIVGAASVPMFERWVARMLPEFQRRGEVMAEGAARTSGIDAESAVEHALHSEDAQPLVARILDAATRTNANEILWLLGGMLGVAASDGPRRVDEDLMLVDAIDGLTPAHLHVMQALEEPADPGDADVVWLPSAVSSALGSQVTEAGLITALGGLVSRGLVTTHPTWEQTGYRLSKFGLAMLQAARASKSA
jgi:hypothetical protein